MVKLPFTLEICAGNLASALNAYRAGAQRIELCTSLDTGGLTPSAGLIKYLKENTLLTLNVLIRPRPGNFCYNNEEFQVILDDIQMCKEAGADGIVVGLLNNDLTIDIGRCSQIKDAVGNMSLTFHRAFDMIEDSFQALEELIVLGYDRILTSGTMQTAYEGLIMIQELNSLADGRIIILPGSGINPSNIDEIIRRTKVQEIHASAILKSIAETPDIKGFRNQFTHNPEAISHEETIRTLLRLGYQAARSL